VSRITQQQANEALYRPDKKEDKGWGSKPTYYALDGDRASAKHYLAKTWKHSVYQNFEVAVDDNGLLYNPLDKNADEVWRYVPTKESVFRCYLAFLKTGMICHLETAERQRGGQA